MRARPISVFCDFDGTITEKDMVVRICERFCPPRWQDVAHDILSRKKSVKEGVAELFAMIPSNKKNEIVAYAQEVMRLRSGFEDFLDFCETNGLQFIVCSGGIDFFVDPLLLPFRKQISKIYSIPADFSGSTIQLRHIYACDRCGTCKMKVMQDYPGHIKLLIGDSITDVHGAQHADRVYARNGLQTYLQQDGIAYTPFETFHDIIAALKQFQGPVHG